MKAIVKAKPERGGLELRDVPRPEPGPEEVLIRTHTAAICGTDYHIYQWDAWSQSRLQLPRIIGHEFCGHVSAVGADVVGFREGDFVSAEGHLTCGECRQCRTGQGHVCNNFRGLGYDVDGAFAEYLAVPARNVWRNAPGLDPEVAAIQDPLGNAVHTVFSADCAGQSVAVVGCGPVGLMCVAVAKAIGAHPIIAVDRTNPYRLDLAAKLGADHALDDAEVEGNTFARVRELAGGAGVDVAMETAGATAAITAAVRGTRPGGTVVLLGIPNENASLDIANDVVFRGITIKGVTGRRIWDTWFRMAGLLSSGQLDLAPILTHSLPLDEYEEGFRLMQTGECGKVVLRMQ